jgi:hypothetical protein
MNRGQYKTAFGVLVALLLQLSVAFVVPSRQSPIQVQRVAGFSKGLGRFQQTNVAPLSTVAMSTEAVAYPTSHDDEVKPMSNFAKKATKVAAIAYVATVAIGLISTLSFIKLLGYFGISTETRRQKWALSTGQFVARWALRLIPFCKVDVIADKDADYMKDPEPAIWVCNHMSMLDVFLLLASDRKLRGNKKRPIKVVYVSKRVALHWPLGKHHERDGLSIAWSCSQFIRALFYPVVEETGGQSILENSVPAVRFHPY